MNKNARCYYEASLQLLLLVEEAPEIEGFKLSLGKKNYFFCGGGTPLNNAGSVNVANSKYSTNKFLEKAGFPVPKAEFVHITEYRKGMLEEKIAGLSFPLVAKPQIGKLGKNVLCNIQTLAQLKKYMNTHFASEDYISVEEFHDNLNSYRVLVAYKRILGVIQRYPAHVVGDGQHNLQELVDLTNIKRTKISDTLGPIVIDEECQIRLNELGLTPNYVPQQDELITLGYTSNATRGGTYRSIGKQICKQNRRMIIRAAAELNLDIVGFDIQCPDINLPIETTGGVIIEANCAPSVRIHERPIKGIPVKVCKKIMRGFLCRHPLSYLYTLYKNKRSAIYIRLFILAAFLAVSYYGFGSLWER